MTKEKMTIDELEKEMTAAKSLFEVVEKNIREHGGDGSSLRSFRLRVRITKIEKKIGDLKSSRIRTDKKRNEEIQLEKSLTKIEKQCSGEA